MPEGRDVKISAGVKVLSRVHKARGGLIRADFEIRKYRLGRVHISGDFFCFPESGIQELEAYIEGIKIDELEEALRGFYSSRQIETPGIEIGDWMNVLGPGGGK